MDRRKGGLKRKVATEASGIRLGIVSAGANRHDSPLLAPTFAAAQAQVGPLPEHVTGHLDAGHDSGVTRDLLTQLGFDGEISRKGVPAPIQVGKRWVVERTQSWMNGYGKLRRCTDKNKSGDIVDFYPYLAAAFVTVRRRPVTALDPEDRAGPSEAALPDEVGVPAVDREDRPVTVARWF